MSLELREAAPVSPVHPPQAIVIGGKNVGQCEWKAHLGSGPGLGKWHTIIQLPGALFQGFGETPEQAVANAVETGRKERDVFAEQLAWLEGELRELLAAPLVEEGTVARA